MQLTPPDGWELVDTLEPSKKVPTPVSFAPPEGWEVVDEEQGPSGVSGFFSRAVPGVQVGAENIGKSMETTAMLAATRRKALQNEHIGSVLDTLAAKKFPMAQDYVQDRFRADEYKKNMLGQIQNEWDAGRDAHGVIAQELATVDAPELNPHTTAQAFRRPELWGREDEFRKERAEGIAEHDKAIQEIYTENPLPSDWGALSPEERRAKYPALWLGETVFPNAPQAGLTWGSTLAGALVGHPEVGAAVGSALMYPQMVAEISDEIRQAAKEEGLEVSDEAVANLSLGFAVPSSAVETLGERVGLGKIPGLKGLSKAGRRKVIMDFLRNNLAAKGVAWLGKTSAAGGAEEAAQKAIANVAAKVAGSGRSIAEGTGEAAIAGAVAEPLLGAGPAAINAAAQARKKGNQGDDTYDPSQVPTEEPALDLTEEQMVKRGDRAFPKQQDQFMERVGDPNEVPLDLKDVWQREYPDAIDADMEAAMEEQRRKDAQAKYGYDGSFNLVDYVPETGNEEMGESLRKHMGQQGPQIDQASLPAGWSVEPLALPQGQGFGLPDGWEPVGAMDTFLQQPPKMVAGQSAAPERDSLQERAEAVKTDQAIPEDGWINGITRSEAGRLMAQGDDSVVEHVAKGVAEHGKMPMEDAIRNEQLRWVANTPQGPERERVRRNIAKVQPMVDKVLSGAEVQDVKSLENEETREQNNGVLANGSDTRSVVSDVSRKHHFRETQADAATPPHTAESLAPLKKRELVKIAQDMGVQKPGRMQNDGLRSVILAAQRRAEASPVAEASDQAAKDQDVQSVEVPKPVAAAVQNVPDGVNVKADGTPYTEKTLRLALARQNKNGVNVEPVQLADSEDAWGWRVVPDEEGPQGSGKVQAKAKAKILEFVKPDDTGARKYDDMVEYADRLIDDEGYSVDDVYEAVNQIEEAGGARFSLREKRNGAANQDQPAAIDRSNFMHRTMAKFKKAQAPNRTPDYVSSSGSKYWYDDNGVFRESNHWGNNISESAWYLHGQKTKNESSFDYNGRTAVGYAPWAAFEHHDPYAGAIWNRTLAGAKRITTLRGGEWRIEKDVFYLKPKGNKDFFPIGHVDEFAKTNDPRSKFSHNAPPTDGIRVDEVSEVVDAMQRIAVNAPEAEVLQSVNQLPAHLRKANEDSGKGVHEAVYDEATGKVYFIADNISSKPRALALWLHEAGLHNGLRGLFASPTHFRNILDMVWRSAPRKELRKIMDLYGLSNTMEGRLTAAEEYLARVAEKVSLNEALAPKERTVWKRIVAAIKRIVRRAMGRKVPPLSENDIAGIVHDAVRWTTTGKPTGAHRKAYQKATGEDMARPTRPTSARFSRGTDTNNDKEARAKEYGQRVSETSRKWARVVEDVFDGKVHPRTILQMGQTPDLLAGLGAPDLPLVMTVRTFNKVAGIKPDPKTGHMHKLSKRQMKNLYAALADPVAVLQPNKQKMEVVVEMVEDGQPVFVALDLKVQEGRIQVNSVATAFGNDRIGRVVLGSARAGNLLFLDPQRLDALEDGSDNLKRENSLSVRVLQARRGKKIKFPSDVVKPVGKVMFSRKEADASEVKFSDPKTEARFQGARKGIGDRRTLRERWRDTRKAIGKALTYHQHMPKTKFFAQAHEILRQQEAAPGKAKETALRKLDSITDKLNPKSYELFTRAVILRDLLYEVKQEHALPFGYTTDGVKTDARTVAAAVKQRPEVIEALKARDKALKEIKSELLRTGVMEEEQFHNPAYFRHQVITYAAERIQAEGKRGRLRKPRPGYAKKREGSLEDINANYLEAEFEYMHRAMVDVATADTIDSLAKIYDKRAESEALAEKWNKDHPDDKKTWKEFIPEGYTTWSPETGNVFQSALSASEKAMNAALEWAQEHGLPGIDKKHINEIAAQIGEIEVKRGRRYNLVIPEELALTMDDMSESTARGFMNAAFAKPLTMWKQWVLMNPRRVLKYNLNNMSGDMDAVIAGSPKAIKKLPQAIKELWQVMHGGQPTERYQEALDRGVFDTGLTIHEIPEINKLEAFRKLRRGRAKDIPLRSAQAIWRTLKDYTQFRENWLRYAAYLDYVERLEAGETMESIGYGAAHQEMVDGLPHKKDKAALLARELVGDYGAISALGKEMREKLIPFYSWLEINTRRYNRIISNAFKQGVIQGVKTGGVLATAKGVKLTAWIGMRTFMMYALIMAWNNWFFGDLEDELSAEERRRLHVILGRDKDGKIMTVRFQGAISDYLQWIGFEDAVGVAIEMNKGRASFKDLAKAIGKAPVNKVAGGITPLIKTPVEMASKRSFWPDVFNPRVVRDRGRNFGRLFSVEHELDWLRDRPTRGYWRSWTQSLLYRNDPKEVAYYSIMNIKHDYKERTKGISGSSDYTSWRSQALRDYKMARKFGDKDAEAKAKERMKELGIDRKALKRSILAAHPLYGIPKKERAKFMKSLTPRERKQLKLAIEWWKEVYLN